MSNVLKVYIPANLESEHVYFIHHCIPSRYSKTYVLTDQMFNHI